MTDRYRPYEFAGGLIYLDIDESPAMRRRAAGEYEPEKTAALQRLLEPGMTFVDVGANKGDFSLIAARVMGDQGRVIAFEPNPENCKWIRRSIELNGYRSIVVHELALSDRGGRFPLYLGERSGWHSLLPPEGSRPESIEVETRTLDSVVEEEIDVLKVDVEGAELGVLRGAARALPGVAAVLVDVHPRRGVSVADVWALLASYGFSLRDPSNLERQLPEPAPGAEELFALR